MIKYFKKLTFFFLESFPKRNFRCDCPTAAIAHLCTLHPRLEEANLRNEYGQNFQALFCRCRRPYDPNKEREAMIQCLTCEVRSYISYCVGAAFESNQVLLRTGFMNLVATSERGPIRGKARPFPQNTSMREKVVK